MSWGCWKNDTPKCPKQEQSRFRLIQNKVCGTGCAIIFLWNLRKYKKSLNKMNIHFSLDTTLIQQLLWCAPYLFTGTYFEMIFGLCCSRAEGNAVLRFAFGRLWETWGRPKRTAEGRKNYEWKLRHLKKSCFLKSSVFNSHESEIVRKGRYCSLRLLGVQVMIDRWK